MNIDYTFDLDRFIMPFQNILFEFAAIRKLKGQRKIKLKYY